jgi:hypothetical protein
MLQLAAGITGYLSTCVVCLLVCCIGLRGYLNATLGCSHFMQIVMKPHSISVDEDLKNAAKQVEVFAILSTFFSVYICSPFSLLPPSPPLPTVIFESAESYSVHL